MEQDKPRRARPLPWVFIFVDQWQSARARLFGDRALLRDLIDRATDTYHLHVGAHGRPTLGGVAVLERSAEDCEEPPRFLAVYYGPGDPRNTVADEPPAESRAVVRGPWGVAEEPLLMAARDRGAQ